MEENIKLDLRGGRIGGRLGWGRTGGVENLCPMASHVQLPGDRTVPPCSAHLRRPRAGLKESVCCWGGCLVTQLDSVCNGRVRVRFCLSVGSRAMVTLRLWWQKPACLFSGPHISGPLGDSQLPCRVATILPVSVLRRKLIRTVHSLSQGQPSTKWQPVPSCACVCGGGNF